MLIAGSGYCTQGYTVKTVGKGDDIAAAGYLARDLERGLYRIGTGGAGKLQAVVQFARGQY